MILIVLSHYIWVQRRSLIKIEDVKSLLLKFRIIIFEDFFLIQARWTRHAGHCWRSKDKLISDVLLWTPAYGQAKAGWPARTYIQQLCEDMGCSPEDRLEAMNDREKWWERIRDIRASGTTWWWWYLKNILFLSFIYYRLLPCLHQDNLFRDFW